MRFDFIIPASPTDSFLSQIALFRLALDFLGGQYQEARVVAVFGDHVVTPLPAKWTPYFTRVDIVWTDCAEFASTKYIATSLRCFEAFRTDVDIVVLCDADTLMLRPFSTLIESLVHSPAIAGVIDYLHIPSPRSTDDSGRDWQEISMSILGHSIPLTHHYLLEAEKPCPYYINAGFIIASPKIFSLLASKVRELWPKVNSYIESRHFWQVTIALAIEDLRIPTCTLPRRYNYANFLDGDEAYPEECANIIVFHYFSDDCFNRRRIFTTADRFKRFLALDLSGCNKIFQDHVRKLTQGTYPFPGAEAPANDLEDAYDALRADLGTLTGYKRKLQRHLNGSWAHSSRLEQELQESREYARRLEMQIAEFHRQLQPQKPKSLLASLRALLARFRKRNLPARDNSTEKTRAGSRN
jgi:hypothetical protein